MEDYVEEREKNKRRILKFKFLGKFREFEKFITSFLDV
jgi:hypothetical protein